MHKHGVPHHRLQEEQVVVFLLQGRRVRGKVNGHGNGLTFFFCAVVKKEKSRSRGENMCTEQKGSRRCGCALASCWEKKNRIRNKKGKERERSKEMGNKSHFGD